MLPISFSIDWSKISAKAYDCLWLPPRAAREKHGVLVNFLPQGRSSILTGFGGDVEKVSLWELYSENGSVAQPLPLELTSPFIPKDHHA
jgi:hypothetical protein